MFKEKVYKALTHQALKQVRQTPPMKYGYDDSVVIVSMVGKSSLDMYLLAVKSFIKNFGYGTVEVISDGTLSDDDKSLLSMHIPRLNISEAEDVDTGSCPSYISWKRLLRICELVKKHYVIQLDSDIVACGPLIEVDKKVRNNEGFIIGNGRWHEPVNVEFLSQIVNQWNSTHVQPVTERILKDIDYFTENKKYIRGCAGFAGYPKGSFDKDKIEQLSSQIAEKIGMSKWSEWGSEQTATLCLISQSENAEALPWPRYQNFLFPITNEPTTTSALVHFIGSNRYKQRAYWKLAKSTCAELMNS